jgi:Co/Zn/Cd efflux system component
LGLIGAAFVALAIYIAGQGVYVLSVGNRPSQSALGIAWTAITCAVMIALAYGKTATGRALDNRVLTTEARVTLIDAVLAAAVLTGLAVNAWLGWWWADPVAGFVIVFYGLKEGRAAWRGRGQVTSGTHKGQRLLPAVLRSETKLLESCQVVFDSHCTGEPATGNAEDVDLIHR